MGGGALYTQTDLLHGTYTWGYQFTIEDTHFAEFTNRFGSLAIFGSSIPAAADGSWQPAQLAVNVNILQWTWPGGFGPLMVQKRRCCGGWRWSGRRSRGDSGPWA